LLYDAIIRCSTPPPLRDTSPGQGRKHPILPLDRGSTPEGVDRGSPDAQQTRRGCTRPPGWNLHGRGVLQGRPGPSATEAPVMTALLLVLAQVVALQVVVDADAGRRPISPGLYGRNNTVTFYPGQQPDV